MIPKKSCIFIAVFEEQSILMNHLVSFMDNVIYYFIDDSNHPYPVKNFDDFVQIILHHNQNCDGLKIFDYEIIKIFTRR